MRIETNKLLHLLFQETLSSDLETNKPVESVKAEFWPSSVPKASQPFKWFPSRSSAAASAPMPLKSPCVSTKFPAKFLAKSTHFLGGTDFYPAQNQSLNGSKA